MTTQEIKNARKVTHYDSSYSTQSDSTYSTQSDSTYSTQSNSTYSTQSFNTYYFPIMPVLQHLDIG